ncbi:LytR/AlgR family response regulator transcription factor [Daejeonia sp. YH14]|uniref:LytR/AlgR family response regulator transcription factor n=1 Tax=Daejeonia sp. YH14 TaxID=3439042 RepID=UPI003F49079C
MNYNYIIVEDNAGALKNLQTALKPHQGFREIGVAHTLAKGISLALKAKPHIIFLDVQLGDENGFNLIKEIRMLTAEIPFIIMTTDFDKYAKNAVNADVLYFLDKPIDPDELEIALQKFERRFLELQNHITLKNSEGHYFMQLDDIQYIQSDNNYCRIFRVNQPIMHISKTLKEMEAILPPPFIRIHKSYLINSKYVKMLNTSKKIIRLEIVGDHTQGEIELPISDLYLETVKNQLLTAKPN